jgi:hypothetical protein
MSEVMRMLRIHPRDRASPKCMIFLICFGGLYLILLVPYFIFGLLQGRIITETIPAFLLSIAMLLFGYLLYRYNDRKGAFGVEKYREPTD